MKFKKVLMMGLVLGALAFAGTITPVHAEGQAKNPCTAKNPCAAKNPCLVQKDKDAKNPCAPKNPCTLAGSKPNGALHLESVTRPKGTKLANGVYAQQIKEGERLWKDPRLSSNGMSCDTCHTNHGAFMPSFSQPYPHEVAMMRSSFGMTSTHLDEMVQGCLVMPMESKPLPWDSRELAALTTYAAELQKSFKPTAGLMSNPCAPRNPCVPKH